MLIALLLAGALLSTAPPEEELSPSADVAGAVFAEAFKVEALSTAEASRLAALVENPDCDPRALLCAQGRLQIANDVRASRVSESSERSTGECSGALKTAPPPCEDAVLHGLQALFGIDRFTAAERETEAAPELRWPSRLMGDPSFLGSFKARAEREFAANRCPMSSDICAAGGWFVLSTLADSSDPEDPCDPTGGSARKCPPWPWLNKQVLDLLEARGWPRSPSASLQAAGMLPALSAADPSFSAAAMPYVRRALAEGRAPMLAVFLDSAEIAAGRKQIFGWFGDCTGSGATAQFIPKPVADPRTVERLRAEAGLLPLAEWLRLNTAMCRGA